MRFLQSTLLPKLVMNPASYYDRSKVPWSIEEATELTQDYNIDMMDIIQCADKHKRTPGSIACKLKSLGASASSFQCRGYLEYKKSALYTEVVAAYKKDKEDKAKIREDRRLEKELLCVEKTGKSCNSIAEKLPTLRELQVDIAELKRDVK